VLLMVWLGPVAVAGVILELTGAWAVHYPHVSTHPLESTRMLRGRLLQVLMLNQNYHLVHHLWPRIPWFRYGQAAASAEQAVRAHRDRCRDDDQPAIHGRASATTPRTSITP
jgi:beta-carotene hydroxylase